MLETSGPTPTGWFPPGRDHRHPRVGLVKEGFAVLRFDFTGLGGSGGEFADTNFTSNIEDVVAAADILRDRSHAPSLLVGHSLGGAAVLAAARHIPEVRAVATIGAPCDPSHLARIFTPEAIDEINHAGEAEVMLAGRPFRFRCQFLEDISQQKLRDDIQQLEAALLVMHSPRTNRSTSHTRNGSTKKHRTRRAS